MDRPEPREPGDARVVFGRRPVLELLRSRRPVDRLWVAEGAQGVEPLVALARSRAIPVQRVPREVLRRLCGSERHQGVAARAAPVPFVPIEELLGPADTGAGEAAAEDRLLLVLDHLMDPHNVGALLRTAEAVGVTGVVMAARRGAPITPAVERASAGAVHHLRLSRVSSVAEGVARIKEAGFWVVGADPSAPSSLWEADLRGPLAVVVGAEGEGISPLVRRRCDLLVRIPMWGRVGSLNASVAGALVLYEIRRRRAVR